MHSAVHTVDPCVRFMQARPCVSVHATSGTGLLQRLGRVLKEKAAGDFDRFFKGTSKTRERLGVSSSSS